MPWRKGNRLQIMPEGDASPRVREIYTSIRQTLKLPSVATFFQAYGMNPAFLEMFWNAAEPIAKTQRFAECSDRLRADCFTRVHNYFVIPDVCEQMREEHFSPGALAELQNSIQLFYFSVPITLMLAALQLRAFDGPVGDPKAPREPYTPAWSFQKPIFIDEEKASPIVHKVYEEMKRQFETQVVHRMYRSFARFPDFLLKYWDTLRVIVQSPLYSRFEHEVRITAEQLTYELPGPYEVSSEKLIAVGIDMEEISSLVRITELFERTLPSTLLNVCVAKIGIEGGSRKFTSGSSQPEATPVIGTE
ncbi:MAG TPA: halocarboxylic acid dehydrogenase DehI family protein [Candidatus Acidoferrales bacterium]|nr:halocarboxylic acid dehydrogenase DehI family protein [Candidatus Acidoferrales bacterium]